MDIRSAAAGCARLRLVLLQILMLSLVGPGLRAQEFALFPLGGATASFTPAGQGAFDVTARGRGSQTSGDQLAFIGAQRAGNFDIAVRVADLEISDPFVRAGLMVRSGTETNAPFAAAYVSSALAGCFFEARSTLGGGNPRSSSQGGFPSAPPDAWVRLTREGSQLTGYGSVDGIRWTRLGGATISLPATAWVGLAVASQDVSESSRVQFRNYGEPAGTTVAPWVHVREWAVPSSRRTGLVISEIQYDPGLGASGTAAPEFIEIANHGDIFVDLTGWRLTGGVEYRFPAGFKLEAGAMVVVTSQPDDLRPRAGYAPVLGPWEGNLSNQGDRIELRDNIGAIKLQLEYSPEAPWPAAAAGTGHSLVLATASYGEADPRAWAPSMRRGGSPGRRDPLALAGIDPVVINEFLAHTDLPELDFVELYNRSTAEVDLSGWILTDDIRTNRFRFPAGTRLAAGTHVSLDETRLGFRLSAAGETILLLNPDATRVVDAIAFGGQENGVATGRVPDGSDTFRRLSVPTPGAGNGAVRQEPLVINEIFYNPPSGNDADEFVELHHRGGAAVDLTGWRLRGGIDYEFPPGTRVEPGQFLVVAKDPARLRGNHPTLPASAVVGGYAGALGNSGDTIRLTMPDEIRSTNDLGQVEVETIRIVVGEVRYYDGGAWGKWADGGGSSLELMDPDADPGLGANWADSDESAKAVWTRVEWTGALDNGNAANGINRLYLGLLNDGECLVDDIEVVRGSSTNFLVNPGFESGATSWLLGGNHAGSRVEAGAARTGAQGLRIRAQGGLDTGINSIRGILGSGLASGNVITLRASVKWVAGWPELLFRIRGGFADYPAPLAIPTNLGTPGRVNSRRVENSGPAVVGVTHFPQLPRVAEDVFVTARVHDPDVVTGLSLEYRVDPQTSLTSVAMRDDGQGGDALAADGVYTGRIPAPGGTSVVAFRVKATDSLGATSTWPRLAPVEEGLVRWGDPIPFGSFPHVHLWATTANRSFTGGTALNNALRRCVIVYGNTRVVYNCLFRDKGSPYHNGSGDIVAWTPDDDRLHGVSERLFSKTGNGESEATALRGRVSAWIASQMGIPSLNGRYQFFYVNGGSFANVVEDQEEPDHRYAEHHYPEGGEGDLYKISIWFEFSDSNTSFTPTQATLQQFRSGGELKLARYRWNWERRAQQFPESDYRTIFDLVGAINSPADPGFVNRMLQQADVDQWMHVFAFHRVTGNWDSWTYDVGQNMYIYRQPGGRAVLMPWDIDFVLGLGHGTTAAFWGGQDPIVNTRIYDNPTFRRMLWRALSRAANGPMLPQNYLPVLEGYRAVQIQNNVTGLAAIDSISTYLNGRRSNIQTRYAQSDTATFAITTNGGADYTSAQPTTVIAGSAPLRVADIAVNGVRYPVTWTSFTAFSVTIPLTAPTNQLQLVALDRDGNPIAGLEDTVRVVYPGAIPQARDWVVINEIQYNPLAAGTSFVEIHNRHTSVPFNLAGFRLDGVGYTFPSNATVLPGGFLVVVGDRAAFGAHYGAGVPIFDEFTGRLDNNGERLRLVPPGDGPDFSQVRYTDRLPWPTNADGFGPSLQLVDAAQDTRRPANWAAAATNATVTTTPGAANTLRAVLPPFPGVWLNEVFPEPPPSITDNAGDADPFIELFNPGPVAADLTGIWLSDSVTEPLRWAFPAGTRVESGAYLRVWLDGEPAENATGHLHAGFRLRAGSGRVLMSRLQGSPAVPAALDDLEYHLLGPGRGFGSVPDGQPQSRRPLYVATPGAANSAFVPEVAVVLNEVMAQNTTGIIDPADGAREDWIELYNPGAVAVDLSGYHLTDDLADPSASALPPGTKVPAGGFLLIWADGETGQTDVAQGQIHAGFSLARTGEQLGLFAPDGSVVDSITFGEQTANISFGRYPDGPDGDWIALATATPEAFNFVPGGNQPPRFGAVAPVTIPEGVRWTLRAAATDPDPGQVVRYSLGADMPAGVDIDPATGDVSWNPDETQGPGSFLLMVRATDSGTPPLSGTLRLQVNVTEVNRPPELAELAPVVVGEGSLLAIDLDATDPDVPAQALAYSLGAGAPAGAGIDAVTGLLTWVPSEDQGSKQFTLNVVVTDDGSPALTTTRELRVTVEERDNVPTIVQPNVQFVDEGVPVRVALEASDPEGAPLRFSFQSDVPAGLTMDEATGVIRWTPGEEQGPGNYVLIVQATEQSALAQTAQATFSIVVREANQAPVLGVLPSLVRYEGEEIELTVIADDPDLPAQDLVFSLASTAAGKASIDPISGRLRWQLPQDVGPTNLNLTVRVADGASSPLSVEADLAVQILPRFRVLLSEIMNRPGPSGTAYVELFNPSAVTAWDLSGTRLVGRGMDFTMPAGTVIGPGAALCIAANPAVFRSSYGSTIPVLGAWTGSIGIDGDDLRLVGVNGELLDRVTFTVGGAWPSLPAGGGVAFQVIDVLEDNNRPGNWTALASFTGPRRPLEYTSAWRYLDTGAPPEDWAAPAFDDAGWKLGNGLLYNEASALPAPKTTQIPLGRLAYYFRTTFVLPAAPTGATLALSHIIDDGAVFRLNGVEINRFNLEAGIAVTPTTLANVTVGDAAVVGPVNLPGTLLRAGANVLAVEVHQSAPGSSDIVFGAALEIVGGTIPSLSPGSPNNVAAELEPFPSVYINEVSPVAGELRDSLGDAEPWIELHNGGFLPVDLSGWTLNAAGAAAPWSLAAGVSLAPGERRIVFLDAEPAEDSKAEWHASFRPAPADGWISLSRPAAIGSGVVDWVAYGTPVPGRTLGWVPEGGAGTREWRLPTATQPNDGSLPTAPTAVAEATGDGVGVRWTGAEGFRYRLESTSRLGGEWQVVGRVVGSGGPVDLVDPQPPADERYYRVVVE